MLVHRSAVQVSIPGVRTGSPRRSRRLAASPACVLAATIVVGLGATTATAGQFGRSPPAALDLSVCPGGARDAGRSTDLAYDVLADRGHPHVGAVRVRMTPHWDGQATVSDRIDGAGARRLVQTGGGSQGPATVDVTFSTHTTGTAGTVASTVKPGAGVAASPAKRSIGKGDLSASQSLTFPVGYQGVVYPWSSASMGDLATECHSVDPPHCVTQVHLQGDVALAVWQYDLATGDTAWRRARGWQRRP